MLDLENSLKPPDLETSTGACTDSLVSLLHHTRYQPGWSNVYQGGAKTAAIQGLTTRQVKLQVTMLAKYMAFLINDKC